MKIISIIIQNYEDLWKNMNSHQLLQQWTGTEKEAFQAISDNPDLSNDQLSMLTLGKNPSSSTYRLWKKNFREKLYDLVAVYDGRRATPDQWTYILQYKGLFLVRMLLALGKREIGIRKAKSTLQTCKENQNTIVAMEMTNILSTHYLAYDSNARLGEEYYREHQALKEAYHLETMARYYYAKVKHLLTGKEDKKKVASICKRYIEDMEAHIGTPSYDYKFLYYLIKIYYLELIQESYQAKVVSQEAYDYFRELPYSHTSAKKTFRNRLVEFKLEYEDLDGVDALLEENLAERAYGHSVYYDTMSLIRVYIYKKNYEEASQLLEKTITSPFFQDIPEKDAEHVWIYKLYLELATNKEEANVRRIKNNLTRLTQQKERENISFLIGEAICKIFQHGPESMYDREEYFKNYMSKHLDPEIHERTIIFMNMLILLPASRYEPQKYKTKIADLHHRLVASNRPKLKMITGIELIPYEDLWEMVEGDVVKVGVRAC